MPGSTIADTTPRDLIYNAQEKGSDSSTPQKKIKTKKCYETKPKRALAAKPKKAEEVVNDASAFQTIPGLDTKLGLKRVMGKMPLYLNMLRKYVETGYTSVSDLRNALVANDKEVAERVAHTCKGVNGNIGASALQAMAGSIEKSVKEHLDQDQIMREFEVFAIAQISMVDAISSALPLSPIENKVSGGPVSNKPMDKQVLDKYIELLKDDDTEANVYLERHEIDFKAHFSEVIFNNMTNALLDFDFEKALALATS